MSIQGKTVVFTGRISKPRHVFAQIVEEHGGIFSNTMTKSTDYLVVGEDPGSKLAIAALSGVKTLSEAEFLRLLAPEDQEDRLAPAELQSILADLVLCKCQCCGKEYKQWSKLPNLRTCSYCEVYSEVKCPNCDWEPIFVEDFGMYTCMFCGCWFEGPHILKLRHVKHLHMWLVRKREGGVVYMACPADSTRVQVPDDGRKEATYAAARRLVQELRRKDAEDLQSRRERQVEQARDEKFTQLVKGLSDEERADLKRQIEVL